MTAQPKLLFNEGTKTEVQELMSKQLVTILESETVRDALSTMKTEQVSALPVVNHERRLVGLITIGDLLKTLLTTAESLVTNYPHYDDCLWAIELIQRRLGTDKVVTIMSEVLTTITPDQTMHHAACIMLNNHVHHLPVVTSTGDLIGILSSQDFATLAAGIR